MVVGMSIRHASKPSPVRVDVVLDSARAGVWHYIEIEFWTETLDLILVWVTHIVRLIL